MRRIALALLATVGIPTLARAQDAPDRDALIASALSAGPPALAEHATVMTPDGTVLREGSGPWTCIPDDPDVPNNSPMCLDDPWLEALDAWANRRDPEIDRVGVSYMLQGDMPVSNVDPFATGPEEGNEWIHRGGPHLMVVFPDPAVLDGLPDDPREDGPFVMWKDTPYAHLMIPTGPRGR